MREANRIQPGSFNGAGVGRDAALQVSMSSPCIDDSDRAAVMEVLRSTALSIGPRVEAFERSVAQRARVPHAVAVSSGTAGLHLGVIAAGVGQGDFVITTPFSFVASANVILYERAVPIFVDVDEKTGNIDPGLVAEAADDLASGGIRAARWLPPAMASTGQRGGGALRALLPVHTFGEPADMDPLMALADRHSLHVIEDACEAIGAEYKGRPAGTIGDAGVFAFYPNKQMTTGEGGILVTRRDEWDVLFRSLRNQGRDVFDGWLNHSRLGFNYRLDELSAALGFSQHSRLDDLLERRERVAGWYRDGLAGIPGIEVPKGAASTTRSSWFVFVVRVTAPLDRDSVILALAERGIPSRPYFSPIHLQPFYTERFGYQRGAFPVTERLGDISLALPFSGVLPREHVEYVCATLAALASRAG